MRPLNPNLTGRFPHTPICQYYMLPNPRDPCKLPRYYYLGRTSLVLRAARPSFRLVFPSFLKPICACPADAAVSTRKQKDGSQPSMHRCATNGPKVPALWRGRPSARRASSLRFAAPRPTIPHLKKLPASRIKFTSNSVLSRPSNELAPMEAPSLDAIRSRMTCAEFVDSVWGFAVSARVFCVCSEFTTRRSHSLSDLPLCRDRRKCLESHDTTY